MIDFKKIKLNEEITSNANTCYRILASDGVQSLLNSDSDIELVFSFLIYYFERNEEYEKCAYLKKMYDAVVFLKLKQVTN
jgi:hypothetical protein